MSGNDETGLRAQLAQMQIKMVATEAAAKKAEAAAKKDKEEAVAAAEAAAKKDKEEAVAVAKKDKEEAVAEAVAVAEAAARTKRMFDTLGKSCVVRLPGLCGGDATRSHGFVFIHCRFIARRVVQANRG